MKNLILTIILTAFLIPAFSQSGWVTPFEMSEGIASATYKQAEDFYRRISDYYRDQVKMIQYGESDVGKPLKLVVVSKDGYFTPEEAHDNGKVVIMIMNGIHPGESCGVDASMMIVRDLMTGELDEELLDNAVLCIIPIYNVGGSLNRRCCTRANQVGPELQGFRGNGRNLDLNRDFAKQEAMNTRTFVKMYQDWKPELFLDTHTSNGADYQYTMTLISTQKDKLHPLLGEYLTEEMEPDLFKSMKRKDLEMSPYVYTMGSTPKEGIRGFLESPRYSTGYTALFNTIGFVTEAHMLKTFEQRVNGTYAFIHSLLEKANEDYETIIKNKLKADSLTMSQQNFAIYWELDTSVYDKVRFKGYEGEMIESKVTGHKRLFYDRDDKFSRRIEFYNSYPASDSVDRPFAYIIPQAWREVVDAMKRNGVQMSRLDKDTSFIVQSIYVDEIETSTRPWEGHYFHYKVNTRLEAQQLDFYFGDYVVFPNQKANRYIVEMLEPRAIDALFRWNFFDEILMQKEYFSGYVFDDTAYEILENDPELKGKFEQKRAENKDFAKSHRAQLNFIYQNSEYYEPSHRRYPIYRVEKKMTLPLIN